MDSSLQLRRTILMGGLVALEGRDVVAAFIAGGFRIARKERGLALLVRGVQVVVVPETGVLSDARIRALLERAEVEEKDLVSWLAEIGAAARTSSGFRPRTASERPPTVHAAVKSSGDARARADAAHVASRDALASSEAFQEALERWREAMREVDERDSREVHARGGTRKR